MRSDARKRLAAAPDAEAVIADPRTPMIVALVGRDGSVMPCTEDEAASWLAAHDAALIAAAEARGAAEERERIARHFSVASELVVDDVRAQRGDHVASLVEDSFAAHFDQAARIAQGVTSVEPGCTCGGVAACLQCQERDARTAPATDSTDAGEER